MSKNTKIFKTRKQLLDAVWAITVKARAGFICEYTGKSAYETNLEAHHIYHKPNYALRYSFENGVAINNGVHRYVAHGTRQAQKKFDEFIKELRGENIFDFLESLMNGQGKDFEYYYNQVMKEAKKYLTDIKNFLSMRNYRSVRTKKYYKEIVEAIEKYKKKRRQ